MNLPKIEHIGFIGIAITVTLLFFNYILGLSGMLSVFGIIFLFIVPIYFAMSSFDLAQDEKIIFSFFMGVGIFPSLAYWLGMIISFRIAILITFIVLMSAAFTITSINKRMKK